MLAINAQKAAFGIVNVLDDQSDEGEHHAISAACEVLGRIGLMTKE